MKNGENNKKIVNFYVKEVKDKFLCPNNVKKAFLQEIRQNISNLENETGVLSIEDLYREIGSPDEIARSFESRDDIEKIKSKAKRFPIIIAVCVVIALLIVSVLVYVLKQSVDDGQITVDDYYGDSNIEAEIE